MVPPKAEVPGSIPASSDTEVSEGAADEVVLNKILKKFYKKALFRYGSTSPTYQLASIYVQACTV
jgi:hypothetical protein